METEFFKKREANKEEGKNILSYGIRSEYMRVSNQKVVSNQGLKHYFLLLNPVL